MRILIHSPAYLPHLGGLEVNTATLADGLRAAGDDVVVVTRTPGSGAEASDVRVERNPSPVEFLRLARWSDVVLHRNVALRGLWPLALVRRPLVVSNHSWYRSQGRQGVRDRLKRMVVARASGVVAVSGAIARDLGIPAVVIPNAYRADLFRCGGGESRDRELLFVGRLVSDKGVDLLIEALADWTAPAPGLTVVGEGPERERLESQARSFGIGNRVEFLGALDGEGLASVYRRHRVLVVPSRYEEPFGIVALEGMACGCLVVASDGGGLPEAVGPCGLLFRRGSVTELRVALRRALEGGADIQARLSRVFPHLERHQPAAMVAAYRRVLSAAIGGITP